MKHTLQTHDDTGALIESVEVKIERCLCTPDMFTGTVIVPMDGDPSDYVINHREEQERREVARGWDRVLGC